MPEGTGLWLNNGLGEIELNRRDVDSRKPGERLPSNMAPTVARSEDATMAIGSPGADRITTAIHQVLVNTLQFGMPIADAIAHPRVHVDTTGAGRRSPRGRRVSFRRVIPCRSFDSLRRW
jgi:gamma-glutamyltranspeptidase/glutathione hydrolase